MNYVSKRSKYLNGNLRTSSVIVLKVKLESGLAGPDFASIMMTMIISLRKYVSWNLEVV